MEHGWIVISWPLYILAGTPQYESSSKIVANQTQETNQVITNTDIQTNLNLINMYQSIIRERIILKEVLDITGSNLTISELRNKINVQTQDSSLVFGASVQDESPYCAAEYANAIADTFANMIGDILKVQSVNKLNILLLQFFSIIKCNSISKSEEIWKKKFR